MPVFKIEPQKGVWFDFPSGGRVKIKNPAIDDYIRIAQESTKNEPFLHEEAGKPPQIFNHEIPDNDKRTKLINDCTIEDWEGFVDENGKEIPCNSQMKTVLMRLEDATFRDFVKAKLALLDEAEKAHAEEAEKNLSTSQSGDPALDV